MHHFGLQAKAGNLNGKVNPAIDEFVGQADDAFKMPYYDIASTEARFISTLIIGIGGDFTANAKIRLSTKFIVAFTGHCDFLIVHRSSN